MVYHLFDELQLKALELQASRPSHTKNDRPMEDIQDAVDIGPNIDIKILFFIPYLQVIFLHNIFENRLTAKWISKTTAAKKRLRLVLASSSVTND